jgi:SAM-dependent methyltransferase
MTYEGAGARLSSPDRAEGTSGGPVFPEVSVKTSKASPPSPEADPSMLHAAYRRFWARVGSSFPDLGEAASTRLYVENERRLFREHFPALPGLTIFKTDLWDEARNTRILAWASEQGALPYGVDISPPTAALARAAFANSRLRCAVSDVRAVPFAANSFDAIYSMGTIEHFDETEQAVREMARVLKPGGRAIVGVPNRHDPFLRPLLSTVLQWLGLYAYGFEKSYSRRALRKMLEDAGLTVVAETAILFIPGWLRMLDLACHSWCRPLTRITAALVWPFVFLDRHVKAVRRYGYLLATVVTKEARPKA